MLTSLNPTLIFASIFAAMLRRGIELPGIVDRTIHAFLEQQLGVGFDFGFDEIHKPSTHKALKGILNTLGVTTKQDAGFLHVVIPKIFGNFTTVSYLLGVVVAPDTDFYRMWAMAILDHDRMELSLQALPAAWVTTLRADRTAVLTGEDIPFITLLSQGSDLRPPGWLRVLSAEIWQYERKLQIARINKAATDAVNSDTFKKTEQKFTRRRHAV